MTLCDFQLKALTVEAFRGFRDSATFDLDASTVIFTGPNGTGKTSVFDALQWLLLGSIDRLEGLRARKNVEYVVNTYCSGMKASVTVSAVVAGRTVTLHRRGDHQGSTLEVSEMGRPTRFGDAAEQWLRSNLLPKQPQALDVVMGTCGLLQQDMMQAILETKPSELHSRISTVLGLSSLEEFEFAVRESAKNTNNLKKLADEEFAKATRMVESLSAQVGMLEGRAMRRASVEVARNALLSTLREAPEVVHVETPQHIKAKDAISMSQASRHLSHQVSGLLESAQRLHNQMVNLDPEPTVEQLNQIARDNEKAIRRLKAAEVQHQRTTEVLAAVEGASRHWARLAAAAIPLLAEECPVCGQSIKPEEVEDRLRRVTTDTSRLVECRQSVETATSELENAKTRKRDLEAELALVQASVNRWRHLREREETLTSNLRAISGHTTGPVGLASTSLGQIEQTGPHIVAFLDRLATALERYSDVVKESQATGEMDRARSELSSAQALLQSRRRYSNHVSLRASRLKQLVKASTQARVDVTNARFAAIAPLVTDIYSRLDPHPAFNMIEFAHDTYYGKGIMSPVVRDVIAEVKGDPLIVFSASQANIVALSCFLAMSLGAGERGLPFVLLDDPVQSMDDINVLGFADLCRFLRAKRQLIVSTHDRRLANLLRRKLAPRDARDRTLIHQFLGWDRRGPSTGTELLTYNAGDADLRLLPRPA